MTAAATPATVWKLDPAHTSVEFSVKHLMISTVKGRFADVEGTVTATGREIATASLEATIKTASIDTRNEQRDGHLRSADFFDSEHFPELTFRSTGIKGTMAEFALTGDLTIHGITKPITLQVTFEGEGKDPWGGTRAGFSATGKFDRREYGLVWNQALETGGVVVSNDVKVSIDAELVQG